ncbi:MAG: outer membrane protein assembly factor BamD [Rhodobacteraceae bacterium]|nr:outer membrane protein assembly factor BamD [Paracoccaceae bacterium]
MATLHRIARVSALFALVLAVAACSDDGPKIEEMSAEQIHRMGERELSSGNAKKAARTFAEIERIHPYSSWLRLGLIQSAQAHYLARNFEESRTTAQRFLDIYPNDVHAARAQDLVARSYYDDLDERGLDGRNARLAWIEFNRVVEDYPESAFAQSARLKMDLVVDRLAAREMAIGRYYLSHGHYSAALKRFQRVVDNTYLSEIDVTPEDSEEIVTLYDVASQSATNYVPEALYRQVDAYLSLGLTGEARDTAALLGHNFPGSEWYVDTYALMEGDGSLEPPRDRGGVFGDVYRRSIRGDWI